MPRPRLDNLIEHITGTENHYLIMDMLEGTVQARDFQPDSSEWFAWLTQLPSFHFRGKSGHFTARSERKRHCDYWYAYRKEHRQIYKRYLGITDKLTLASLEQTARHLHEEVLRNLPANEVRTVLPQKATSQEITLGEVTFRWDDGVLVMRTPAGRYFLNKAQSADLLGYLYDQRGAFLNRQDK
jgi:hypothetical protein